MGGERPFPRNSRAMVPKTGNSPLCRGSGSPSWFVSGSTGQPRLSAHLESVLHLGMTWPVSYSRAPIHKSSSSFEGRPHSAFLGLSRFSFPGRFRGPCSSAHPDTSTSFRAPACLFRGDIFLGLWDAIPAWGTRELSPVSRTYWAAWWRTQSACGRKGHWRVAVLQFGDPLC